MSESMRSSLSPRTAIVIKKMCFLAFLWANISVGVAYADGQLSEERGRDEAITSPIPAANDPNPKFHFPVQTERASESFAPVVEYGRYKRRINTRYWVPSDMGLKPPPCHYGGACFEGKAYTLEMQIRPSGRIKAWVRDKNGEPLAVRQTTLKVTVPVNAGPRHTVALSWDAPRHWYVGFVPSQHHVAAGQISAQLTHKGKTYGFEGFAPLTPFAQHGGVMIAVGPNTYELLPYMDGHVEAYVLKANGQSTASTDKLQLNMLSETGKVLSVPLRYSKKHKMFLGFSAVKEPVGTGPIELEVLTAKGSYRGSVIVAKPLPVSELEGWSMIAGPYTAEIARMVGGRKLVAVVRDDRHQAQTSKQIDVELVLHYESEEAGDEVIQTMPLAWNALKMRFEIDAPKDVDKVRWVSVQIRTFAEKPASIYNTSWVGAIQW